MNYAPMAWVVSVGRRVTQRETYLRVLAVLFVALVLVLVVLFRDDLPTPQGAGYVGVFLLPLIGSASIFLPVPGLAAVYLGGAKLIPIVVALLAGTAETLGELTGYAAGVGGRGVLERARFYRRICGWMERRGSQALFLFSAIPNPLFDLVGIAAGSLRFPLWRFLLSVWLGKLLKNIAIAYAGALSLKWLLRLYETFLD